MCVCVCLCACVIVCGARRSTVIAHSTLSLSSKKTQQQKQPPPLPAPATRCAVVVVGVCSRMGVSFFSSLLHAHARGSHARTLSQKKKKTAGASSTPPPPSPQHSRTGEFFFVCRVVLSCVLHCVLRSFFFLAKNKHKTNKRQHVGAAASPWTPRVRRPAPSRAVATAPAASTTMATPRPRAAAT